MPVLSPADVHDFDIKDAQRYVMSTFY